jgi:small-conductance mechanosensitive channel
LSLLDKIAADLISFLLNQLLPTLLIILSGWLIVRVMDRVVQRVLVHRGVKSAVASLAIAAAKAVAWVLIIAAALQPLGLSGVALALSGAISLGTLGLITAVSGSLGDILAGIFLATDPDFKVGYKVSTNNITGVVESVDLRKTRIRDEEGTLHVIPNKSVEESTWQVLDRGRAAGDK